MVRVRKSSCYSCRSLHTVSNVSRCSSWLPGKEDKSTGECAFGRAGWPSALLVLLFVMFGTGVGRSGSESWCYCLLGVTWAEPSGPLSLSFLIWRAEKNTSRLRTAGKDGVRQWDGTSDSGEQLAKSGLFFQPRRRAHMDRATLPSRTPHHRGAYLFAGSWVWCVPFVHMEATDVPGGRGSRTSGVYHQVFTPVTHVFSCLSENTKAVLSASTTGAWRGHHGL